VAGSCKQRNKPSDSIKGGEFLEQLSVLSASHEGLCFMELLFFILPPVYLHAYIFFSRGSTVLDGPWPPHI
jgi:hypothetical protein